MEEEKRGFTARACSKARILLASALKSHYVFASALLLAAGAVVQFASADLFQPAFAAQSSVAAMPDANMQQVPAGNSYYRSVSESLSVVASHGSGSTTSSPMSYYRSMSESMSVTTVQGKPPNSYSRSMSEQASLTTGMPPSAPASPQARAAPAPYSASSNQRIDERFSLRNLAGSKTDSAYRNTVTGTPVYSDPMSASYELSGSDAGIIIRDTASVDGDNEGSDDSSSALLQQLEDYNEYMLMQNSIENAALANLSTSAVLLLGTVAVVVARQPVVSSGRLQKRMYAIFLLKYRVADDEARRTKKIGNASVTYVLLVGILAATPIAVSIDPSSAQEYGANKSMIEISAAYHLDSYRRRLSDIYEESKALDGVWSKEVFDGQYVRVTFNQNLTSTSDITTYPRVVSGTPRIEVYEAGEDSIIAEFASLDSNQFNTVFLKNLQGSQDTFDLRVLDGSVEFDYIVDPSIANFNIQRGCELPAALASTVTLTAGTDYTAPASGSSAFIRLISTRLSGMGDTVGGNTQEAADFTWYISDPDFAGGSVTFTRTGTANPQRLCWQIIEYVGSSGGANEMIVRDVGTVTYTTTGLTVDGPTVSGISNDSDVAVFITGQNSVELVNQGQVGAGLSTSEWVAASDLPRFTRGNAQSDANSISYAVVEFTGSNWAVERIQHQFTLAGTTETETITDVGSTSRAFFHAQFRGGTTAGLDEYGAEMWLSATNQASFLLQSNAGTPSDKYGVIWIVRNSETDSAKAMNVQHLSGTRASAGVSEGANNEEDEWTDTITAVSDLAQSSIMGESGRSAGTGAATPRGWISLYLNSATGVKLYQSDDGQTQAYRFQVVEWPRSFQYAGSVAETFGIVDSVAAAKSVPRTATEQIGLSETAAMIVTKPPAEQLSITETIARSIVAARAPSESAAVSDTMVGARSFDKTTAEQASLSDSIDADLNFAISIAEQAGLQDRIKRDLNGYSAGTVYVSNTGTYGLNSVKYRQWDPTANIWSYEVELPNTGSPIRDVRIAFSPVSEMRVVVSHSADGTLNLFRCDAVCIDPASWTLVSADFADTGTPNSSTPYRFFDIAFEQQSGTLLIAYDRVATQASDLYYRTYDGSTLSGEFGYNYFGSDLLLDTETIPFIRMASKPNSDEIAAVIQDFTRQDAYAVIFDAATGTPSTSNQVTLTSSMGTTSITGEAVGIAYEPGSGRAVAFSANNADSMAYATWDGTAWSSVSTVDPNSGASSNIKFMSVKPSPSPTSDVIMVCQVDDQLDLTCAEMENGSLGSFTVIDSDVNSMTTRPFDFVWNQAGSSGTLAWGTSAGVVNWAVWNGSSWGSSSTTAMTGTQQWIVAHEAPSTVETTKAVFMATSSANMTGSLGIVGSSLTLLGSATHTTDTSSTVTEGMSIDWHFAGIRQPFRLPVDSMAVADTIAVSVTKPRSETMSLAESVRPASVKPLSENLALSETISRVVVKPLSESAALTDTITATRVIPRSMTEQLGVADAIARAFTGSRSPSEQLGVTESITKAVSVAVSEQLGVTDSITRFITISQSVSDQLGVTDAIARAVSKPLIEQLGVVESAARSVVQSRAVSEQLAVTDTIAEAASKPLSEQLGVTDMIARSIVSARTTTEQMAATDSVTKVVSYPLSESLSITESAGSAIIVSRSVTEQLGVAESITKATSKPLTEQLGVSDAATKAIVTSRTLLEQLAAAETIAMTVNKAPAEQIAMTEQLVRSVVSARAMTEQFAVTEAVSVIVSKVLSEQLVMNDSIQRSIVTARALSEQLGVTETTAKAVSKAAAEQLTMTETAGRSVVQSRSAQEQLGVSDAIALSIVKPLAESLSVTDAIARSVDQSASMTEQAAVQDTVSVSITKAISEQMILTDALARATTASRSATEQLGVTDAISVTVSKSLVDQLVLTDSIARTAVQSRSVSEQLAATDSVSIVVTMQLSEQLAVEDALARSVVQSRSISEQLGLSDTAAARVTSRAITESLALADSVGMTVSRSITEQLGVNDSVSTSALKSMAENLAATESISIGVSRSMTEQLGVSDAAVAAISAVTMADDIALSDAVSITISRVASDLLGITESISISVSKSIADNMAISDAIVPTAPGSASESLSLTESITARPVKPLSDQLGVADSIAIAVAVSVADQLSMAVSVAAVSTGEAFVSEQLAATEFITIRVSKQVSDGVALSDAIMIAGSGGMTESMAATDAIARSVVVARAISESLALSASGSPAVFVIITDSMAIDEDFTDISIVFNLNLAQTLVLAQGFATDFEGMFDQADGEGITIGDAVVLVLESTSTVTDALALRDQVSASQTPGRGMADLMGASDSLLMLVTRPPPPPPAAVTTMPNLMITETKNVDKFEGLVDPMEAVEIEGEWDISDLDDDSLESLLETMGMPVYDVDLEAASGDIGDLTMVVPTFWVSMEGNWSDDAGFLTPTLSNLPAGMEVVVPINVQASTEGDENLGMLGNMTVNFTPAQSAGNFTMLITILDDNPEADIVSDPPNDIPAFFIDVIIVGDFPGMTPDAEAFFEVPPTITFTLTEEWAVEQGAERDSNNVPIIGLFLLDESDGSWLELTEDIEPPAAAVDNVYTYTATLPHFSTYVVTAGATSPEDGGNAGRRRNAEYARSVVESLLVSGSANSGAPGEGEAVTRSIVESLTLRAIQPQPLYQRVITIQNVTVAVSVADIKPAAFGTAAATLNFEITNKNALEEQLVLRYSYSDPASGEMLYEGEQAVMVGAGQSLVQAVEVPFYSEGTFDLMIEAESDDGTLATTGIAISVPWLAVYLYVLVAIAVAVVLISIFYVIFAMRRSRRSPDKDRR